jgi:hypothetical protein
VRIPFSLSGLILLACAGCAEPFDTPTAYEGETYLCDAAHAALLAEEIADCRAQRAKDRRACGGVVSFRGQLQGQDVTVSAQLSSMLFANERNATATLRERYDASGDSPYFSFTLQAKEVGFAIDAGDIDQDLKVGASDPLAPLTDTLVDMSMRISAGGDSQDLHARSGTLTLDTQQLDEASGSFSLTLGSDREKLEGCFHFLATRITTVEAVAP